MAKYIELTATAQVKVHGQLSPKNKDQKAKDNTESKK